MVTGVKRIALLPYSPSELNLCLRRLHPATYSHHNTYAFTPLSSARYIRFRRTNTPALWPSPQDVRLKESPSSVPEKVRNRLPTAHLHLEGGRNRGPRLPGREAAGRASPSGNERAKYL